MAEAQSFVGRVRETDETLTAIQAGNNVLIVGRTGIGKTALMRNVWECISEQKPDHLIIAWVSAGTTKDAFLKLAEQIHASAGVFVPLERLPPQVATRARRKGWLPWKDLNRTLRRMTMAELSGTILESIDRHQDRRVLVFLESLEVPPSQADFFTNLIERVQVVAGMDSKNHRVRIEKILWKFPVQIALKPLPIEDCEKIIEQWLEENPLRFSHSGLRPRFVRAVAQQSGGVPEAIINMLVAAGNEDEITPAKVSAMSHEAGRQYLDMTPVIIVGMVVFMALRYVSRGLSDVEMMVLAGVMSAVFIGLRLVMSKLAMKSK